MRQAGPGLGSPAHGHLKPGLNGRSSAGSVASTASARSPSGRAWRGGWRTGGFRPQRSDSPAIRAPAHPAGRRICRWKRWRVSAHRGPRQPARRPNAANEILAGQPRGRKASANRLTDETQRAGFADPHGHQQARSGPLRAPSRTPQRADGAAAVEALDGPRHASVYLKTVSPAAGWAGARIAGESDRCGRKSPVRQPRRRARPDGERAEAVEATEPAEDRASMRKLADVSNRHPG